MAGQKVYSFGANVAVRADPDPVSGGIASSAYVDQSEDGDVIYTDIIFPECISYGSTGLPRYLTDKVEVYSGAEQRQTRWDYPKHEYSIVLENLPADEVAEIMNIWHVCSGDQAAFLFMDPLDNTSLSNANTIAGTVVTPTDQVIGDADGSSGEYMLFKVYEQASRSKSRRIRYPKLDTLRVAVGGVEVENFTYDYTTGLLSFNKAIGSQSATVSISSGVYSGFTPGSLAVGDLVYVTGHTNAADNRPSGGDPLRVTAINDPSTGDVQFEEFDGSAFNPADEVGGSLTLASAFPPSGAQITWGGYFYVPVRFDDGDNMEHEVTAGMRESLFASFNRIKLKEVFE